MGPFGTFYFSRFSPDLLSRLFIFQIFTFQIYFPLVLTVAQKKSFCVRECKLVVEAAVLDSVLAYALHVHDNKQTTAWPLSCFFVD
jgi:hypothetical protein